MPERAKISDALPPHLVTRYHIIPEQDRELYEANLHRIKRWGEGGRPETYGDVSYLPKPEGFSESVLDHTVGMLQMVPHLEGRFPLGREVNWDEVRAMIVIHDAGEIRVGDAPNSGPVRESARWVVRKNYETKAVQDLLSKVPNLNLAMWAMSLHDRYIDRNPNDKEARIANFLDKAQGTLVTGVTIFNNFRQLGHEKPSEELVAHVTTSLAIFREKTANVLHAPLSGRASLNFRDYVHDLLGNLDQEAYRAPLRIVRVGLDNTFANSTRDKAW